MAVIRAFVGWTGVLIIGLCFARLRNDTIGWERFSLPSHAPVRLPIQTFGLINFLFRYPEQEELDRLVELTGARKGTLVADVGCGPGHHALHFARAVGPTGKVYAVDVDAASVAFVASRARLSGLPVIPVVSERSNAKLPPASVDVVLIINVLHAIVSPRHERNPRYVDAYLLPLLRSIRSAVRPNARVLVVDFVPGRPRHREMGVYEDVLTAVFQRADFAVTRHESMADGAYLYVFCPCSSPSARPGQAEPR